MRRNKHLVFVYGTLKRGYGNHVLLNKSKFIGIGFTKEKYILQGKGFWFPFATPYYAVKNQIDCKLAGHVIGEVYEVDDKTLRKLDSLEGHPSFYQRQTTDIVLEDGSVVQCYIYNYYDINERRGIIEPDEYGFVEWNREVEREVCPC